MDEQAVEALARAMYDGDPWHENPYDYSPIPWERLRKSCRDAYLGYARSAIDHVAAREIALRAAIRAALDELHLTPGGSVDWRQTECTDASRAVDALAAAWHALAEPSPAVAQAAPGGPTVQVAEADHRIAEAARVWARAGDAWRTHCEHCPYCDPDFGPGAACTEGLEFADARGEAAAALDGALGEDGGA